MPKMKTFTLDQAHSLLPVLKTLLTRAMDGKKQIEAVENEFQALRQRILMSGGMTLDVPSLSRRRNERDKILQDTKDALAEIHSIGVQVKDLDIGLLDFPCVVGEEIVLLCWKLGEEKIGFWHGQEEGFQGRKPIDERILRGKKREKPN